MKYVFKIQVIEILPISEYKTIKTAETEAGGEEKVSQARKRKHTCQADWKGYGMWSEEAQRRDKKQTFVRTDNPSQVSQCVKMQVSDLDSAPPRRRQPGQPQAPPQADVPAQNVLCLPMVEVAGPDGLAILVHGPWTTSDIPAAMSHLPSPLNAGGVKYAQELLVFCTDSAPQALN